ncbi:MAG: branched-chain amino acid aminotransferase [Actinomycetota bacterium]|jgi:branched-chain amino acid aminotransferase|nr:branched-chain amino acid aminotransferase [Actinomycetota bacterium]
MRTWVNGTVVESVEALVSVFDHGLTVGDGVFETAKVVDGRPFALTRHLQRLAASAAGLGLPAPDLDLVRHAVADTLKENDTSRPLRLRITYTGGLSALGSDRGGLAPTLVVAVAPMAAWPETAALATVPWSRNEHAPTAGLKTTSYADNVVALAHAKAAGAAEALLANTAGHLCEGTGSNVFVVLDGEMVTPPLTSGCLAGVTRALVLEWAGGAERDLPMSVLDEATEVFLTSSTRDVQGVHRVDARELVAAPGPVTRRVAEVFAVRSAADVDP